MLEGEVALPTDITQIDEARVVPPQMLLQSNGTDVFDGGFAGLIRPSDWSHEKEGGRTTVYIWKTTRSLLVPPVCIAAAALAAMRRSPRLSVPLGRWRPDAPPIDLTA